MLLPYSFRKFLSLCRRVPNRRGYGIHSPFAFGFVTGVIGEFYAYDELRKMRRDGSHTLREKDERLLLRIANFQHPQSGTLLGDPAPTTRWALAAGCRKCAWRDDAEASRADMLYAASGSWASRLGKLVEALCRRRFGRGLAHGMRLSARHPQLRPFRLRTPFHRGAFFEVALPNLLRLKSLLDTSKGLLFHIPQAWFPYPTSVGYSSHKRGLFIPRLWDMNFVPLRDVEAGRRNQKSSI